MIKFLKIRDVASPVREGGNAGFDFFVPKFNDSFKAVCDEEAAKNPNAAVRFEKIEGKEKIVVKPHTVVNIPSGIKAFLSLEMPLSSYDLGMDLVVENKSGVSTKKGLDVAACEVDENYMGEIHLSLTNTSDKDVIIDEDDKITQLVPRVYVTSAAQVFDVSTASEEEFYKGFKWTNRMSGGFGSTGTSAK